MFKVLGICRIWVWGLGFRILGVFGVWGFGVWDLGGVLGLGVEV